MGSHWISGHWEWFACVGIPLNSISFCFCIDCLPIEHVLHFDIQVQLTTQNGQQHSLIHEAKLHQLDSIVDHFTSTSFCVCVGKSN